MQGLETASEDEPFVFGAPSPAWAARGRTDADQIGEWIERVQVEDIERVLCLLSERQVAEYDGLLDRYRAAFGTERVTHAPITDHELPTRETLETEVFPALDAAVAADERIVTHCHAGIGRTGVVLAAWLVRERDYSVESALTTVTNRGRSPTDAVRSGNATDDDLVNLLSGL